MIGTSPYRNEQVLIVFPDSNLRRSPNLEEVSVPKLQMPHHLLLWTEEITYLVESLRSEVSRG